MLSRPLSIIYHEIIKKQNNCTTFHSFFFPAYLFHFPIPFFLLAWFFFAFHIHILFFLSFHIMIRHRGLFFLLFLLLLETIIIIRIIYTFTESIHHIALHYTYTLPFPPLFSSRDILPYMHIPFFLSKVYGSRAIRINHSLPQFQKKKQHTFLDIYINYIPHTSYPLLCR